LISPLWSSALRTCGGFFDVPSKVKRLAELEQIMSTENFWSNKEQARKALDESTQIKSTLVPFNESESRLDDLQTMQELIYSETDSTNKASAQMEWDREYQSLEKKLADLEMRVVLSAKNDPSNAILSIHSGAGGTDACDWSELLLRMYKRYAERHNYTFEVIDIQPGDEAGIRSATAIVSGEYAFGYLKAETGVHRLVRISPFNANAARQTSFSSVDVIPEVQEDIEVKIDEKDLKIDTYRSSGAGGQHVNKTDSAVRMTHLPTGIVVACQNERSQIKNRVTAMKILKARIFERQKADRKEQFDKEFGNKDAIAFGSQIRSYFFHPYKLANDHRTGVKISDVQSVMDGDLDEFISAFLKGVKKGDSKDEDDA